MHLSTTVLVTGSTGFIGRAVTTALGQSGVNVLAGYRRTTSSSMPNAISFDLDRPTELSFALQGVDAVVHCAFGDERAMVTQCQTLLDSMSAASVTKLVYFSSIAVHGEGQGPIGFYAEQKARCEDIVSEWCDRSTENRAIILRPGVVYGAGSPLWIEKLSRRIESGVWGDFGVDGEGPATLIHIDDLARVTSRSVDYLSTGAKALVAMDVVGPEVPSWNEYFHALARHVTGKPMRNVSALGRKVLPVLGIAAKVLNRFKIPFMRKFALAPTKGELAMFARKVPYDSSLVPKFLGYQPSIGMAEGLAGSLANHETRPEP